MGDLVPDAVDALALSDPPAAGVAPRPHARHPAGPRHVARGDPPLLRRIGVAPLARDVVPRLEFHFAELLPGRGLVIAGEEAHDEIELVGDRVALIRLPQRVELARAGVVGDEAV